MAAKSKKTLEQKLWDAAEKLRGNQEPSEYKHVVLGLVFLKYVSDRFEERRAALKDELREDGIEEAHSKTSSKTVTNTRDTTFSGYLKEHDGTIYKIKPSNQRSASSSMKLCS